MSTLLNSGAIGIMGAYNLLSSDILVQSYDWTVSAGDTRLSGNPQIMVDLTALRDKINATPSKLCDFF